MRSRVRSTVRVAAVLTAFLASAGLARADFIIPPTGVDSTSSVGTSFTVTGGNYTDSSVLTLTGNNIVNLNDQLGPFMVNAAGVVINAGGIYSNPTGSVFIGGPVAGVPYGALVIGNATLGFFQLFKDTAANGFGSSSPTSTVFTSETIGQIFGAGTVIASGTQLIIKINDVPLFDNSGSFTVSGGLTASSPVSPAPEPTSIVLMGIGAVALIGFRLRRRQTV
jgi:hypothetical protein